MSYEMYLNLGFSVINHFSLKNKQPKKRSKNIKSWNMLPDRNNQKSLQSQARGSSVLLRSFQSLQSLQQRRVRVMPHGKQPVGNRESQIILVEFD